LRAGTVSRFSPADLLVSPASLLQQLGADELARMKSIFQLVDDDKSGSIELPELRQVFAKLDLKMDLENASLLLK
jgi:Ca2+-binding EF-hand superfamily protein